ncbi:rho GTPase-activating protein 20-like isoform X2 [Girardinichthys multiradiatus]|uniref:rho GTPase-activating protein 20-like isoform X2 n=1 Tax=Girardinichthys multiradiatus TaxID=208333 RepID=UPI001FACFA21|nr:rho GTPase-activating protein 20-like isoform X2 [Girardinichthys multiradiatus]
MDNMSPQQQQDSLTRGGQQENKRRMKFQSYRRQSAPSQVITKALTRSKTLTRESFLVPACPETCPLVQSFLTGSERFFLLYGHAQLKTGMQTQDRHLFLFSDVLVIAKAKSANNFKQKAQVCVCEMWTAGCMDEVCEGSTNPEQSFVMGWPTWNCVAMFSSADQKERWRSLLKSRIKEEKEKEEPKTIPLRVYGKGLNTFAVTKTLPVSNWDSANEVIRLALQQFGIIGNVKDFQLWVISKRDNTPYPLIGHEYPFSIQMSHVRNSAVHGGGRDVAAPPADRQMAMQMQVYKQCQFILKPRPVEPPQQHLSADFSQKSFKRRHSLITWAFWRGSSSHLNEMSLAGAARGCLFGQPLSSICVEDALPKPVMDMLMFLYHEGSWTRGIFRRSAGARAVKELRESLDAGQFQLPLTRDHVFIIAGVFKDFLRRIPGSLLGCDVYEEWLDVLEEEEEEEEQVQDIKRMIRRMSKENALLLRYLLAMLHAVQANAQENQMTSFNLSVCIAPSLLWSPGAPCSPEVEGEGTKKVCELVKFMIEHSVQILGEDSSSLFGGPPQRRNSEESGSESWVYPLTDSSYDSLENELDDSSGGSPGFCSRRPLRPKPLQSSLDSILTFSDYDQDTEPEVPLSKAEALLGVRLHSAERCKRKDIPAVEISPSLDSLSREARHSQRRSSEPAIVYAAKFCPYMSGSTDGLSGEEEEVLAKRQSNYKSRGRTMRSGAALGTTSSSLSSTLSSPAHTRSSLDSLDSLSTNPTKPTHPPSSSALPTPAPSIISKDPLHRGAVKGCIGLHPNSWLKKDRRLSLTQLESLEKEEDDRTQGGAAEKGSTKLISNNQPKVKTSRRGSKDTGEKGNIRHPKQEPSSPSLLQRAAGSLRFSKPTRLQSPESALTVQISDMNTNPGGDITIKRCEAPEIKQQPLFYKHSGPSLSLFRRQKAPTVEDRNSRLYQRRGSEPERQVADRASTFTRVRLPSDPGLKLSDADQHGRFCLSPCATKAVRDYFSSHPRSNPQSTQQVALTLVEGQRGEWLKRCSDPTVEPDLEQLLFAEESYV